MYLTEHIHLVSLMLYNSVNATCSMLLMLHVVCCCDMWCVVRLQVHLFLCYAVVSMCASSLLLCLSSPYTVKYFALLSSEVF